MDTTTRTEADMGYVKDFVSLIASALVAATELPKQIEAMQADLTTLHGDLDRTKARNMELDTLTADLRRQRDEAEQALSQVKTQHADASRSLEQSTNEINGYKAQIEHFRSELEQAKRERDDYGLKHMDAEDRAKEAEAKLDKLREAMGIPKPQPTPPPEPTLPEPVSFTPPPTYSYNPETTPPTPSEPITPKRYYEGEEGYNVSKEKWDPVASKYYSEG